MPLDISLKNVHNSRMKDAFEYTDKLPVLPSYRYMVWITQDGFTMLSKIAVFTYLYWNLSNPWFSEAAATGVTQVTLAQVFSCEFGEIFKNTFFTEYLWTTALGFSEETHSEWRFLTEVSLFLKLSSEDVNYSWGEGNRIEFWVS